ncbi:MAG: Uncharacterised protein [Rhodobiaceae bacterium UBA7378]|nr:MAG: Uncharacterised protein [Rhodobiaceae bacterium UBA7378]
MRAPDMSRFDGARATILGLQNTDGSIPWFKGGVIDPWNHLEAAMGLQILGERTAAEKAIGYLQDSQLNDGSWWGQLGSAVPIDMELHQFTTEGMDTGHKIRDTNFTAYIATAVYHHYLIFDDTTYAMTLWPCVEAAINFVLTLQYAEGDIRWTARDPSTPEEDSLVTGNSSIHKSLGHAVLLSEALGKPAPEWRSARARLGHVLAHQPERFDRTWGSKERYSMDWYYPILSGALDARQTSARFEARWDTFVIDGYGCRCVSDEPWVTVAESAELVLALMAAGRSDQAAEHLGWLDKFRDENGAYWMGMQVKQEVFWPVEKPAWTAGAVLLAHDAVHQLTPAHAIFTDKFA